MCAYSPFLHADTPKFVFGGNEDINRIARRQSAYRVSPFNWLTAHQSSYRPSGLQQESLDKACFYELATNYDTLVRSPRSIQDMLKPEYYSSLEEAGRYNLGRCESFPAGSRCPIVNLNTRIGEHFPLEYEKFEFSCPTVSQSFLSLDEVLKNEIHNAAKYADKAYSDELFFSVTRGTLVSNYCNLKIHGFVEYKDGKIIVSFRGTKDLKDWLSNLKFLSRKYKSGTGCRVHIGFSNCYNSLRLQMLDWVNTFSRTQGVSKVIATGHSLGGALATLAAVELAESGYDTDLITFGSPRVGNKQFSEYVDESLKGLNLRVTYKDDIVTGVPPQTTGYWHVGQEIHYIEYNKGYKLFPKMDVKKCRLSSYNHKMMHYKKLY